MTILLVFLLTTGDQLEETLVVEEITDEMLATVDCMDDVDMFQCTWGRCVPNNIRFLWKMNQS
jgi:hypothetical protein